MMFPDPADPERLAEVEDLIDDWLTDQLEENPAVAGFERVDQHQWFVRLLGEEKATFSVLFQLDQRTLAYETYLMPAAEENHERLYAHLLERNRHLYGCALCIGADDGVFLAGKQDLRWVDETELDRILGSLYSYTEQFFRPAMRLGYASSFKI
jgi:hypothetical protein